MGVLTRSHQIRAPHSPRNTTSTYLVLLLLYALCAFSADFFMIDGKKKGPTSKALKYNRQQISFFECYVILLFRHVRSDYQMHLYMEAFYLRVTLLRPH